MPDFSTAEQVRDAFRTIFNDTQQAIPGSIEKNVRAREADQECLQLLAIRFH